jgi:hypothetical protein
MPFIRPLTSRRDPFSMCGRFTHRYTWADIQAVPAHIAGIERAAELQRLSL